MMQVRTSLTVPGTHRLEYKNIFSPSTLSSRCMPLAPARTMAETRYRTSHSFDTCLSRCLVAWLASAAARCGFSLSMANDLFHCSLCCTHGVFHFLLHLVHLLLGFFDLVCRGVDRILHDIFVLHREGHQLTTHCA